MFDKSEYCPVCHMQIKEHRVQNFIDCIEKLINQNDSLDDKPSSLAKNQEALKVIDEILEKTRSILQECDKDPDKNDLAIKYLLNQKQLLNKLKETLS